jgi:hypothetical protein
MAKAKRGAMVGTMVPEDLKEELQRIADADSRSLSFVVFAMIERGLAQYRKDKQLRPKNDSRLAVIRARTEVSPAQKKNKA